MESNLSFILWRQKKMRPSDYLVTLPKEPVYHILEAFNKFAAMPTVCFCNPALLFPPCCSSSTPTASNSTTVPQTAAHSSYHNTSRWLPSPLCLTKTFSGLPQASQGLLTPQQGSMEHSSALLEKRKAMQVSSQTVSHQDPKGRRVGGWW